MNCFYNNTTHTTFAGNLTSTFGAENARKYLLFGELRIDQRVTGWNTQYSFCAKERDEESGYHYYGARYYHPDIGFISADNERDKAPSWSPYVYCFQNPIKLKDPDGNFPIPIIVGGGAAYRATARIMESSKGHVSTRQMGYAMQHPINAARVGEYKSGSNNITTIATNFQVNVSNAAGLGTGNDGDKGNAFRHVLWQGIITNEMGASHAERIGNAHETHTNVDLSQREFTSMDNADRVVDLLNNAIGREIGKQNKGASNQTMAKEVAKEFHENGLWTASKDKNGNISIQKTKITKEQYNAAIKEINKKGDNGLNK